MGTTLLCQTRVTPSAGMSIAALPMVGHASGCTRTGVTCFPAVNRNVARSCVNGSCIDTTMAAATTSPSSIDNSRVAMPRRAGRRVFVLTATAKSVRRTLRGSPAPCGLYCRRRGRPRLLLEFIHQTTGAARSPLGAFAAASRSNRTGSGSRVRARLGQDRVVVVIGSAGRPAATTRHVERDDVLPASTLAAPRLDHAVYFVLGDPRRLQSPRDVRPTRSRATCRPCRSVVPLRPGRG